MEHLHCLVHRLRSRPTSGVDRQLGAYSHRAHWGAFNLSVGGMVVCLEPANFEQLAGVALQNGLFV